MAGLPPTVAGLPPPRVAGLPPRVAGLPPRDVGAGAAAKATHATSPCDIHADASLVRGCGQQSLARRQPKQNIERQSVKTANVSARSLGLLQFQCTDSADHDPDDEERRLLQTAALAGKSIKPGMPSLLRVWW